MSQSRADILGILCELQLGIGVQDHTPKTYTIWDFGRTPPRDPQ